jgi:hypothetical protein
MQTNCNCDLSSLKINNIVSRLLRFSDPLKIFVTLGIWMAWMKKMGDKYRQLIEMMSVKERVDKCSRVGKILNSLKIIFEKPVN